VPNDAHLHLLINHLPVEGAIFGTLVLAFGLVRRWSAAQPVGLWILVVSAVSALPAYLTGEPAEHLIAGTPGFDRALAHEHEAAALWAAIAMGITGVAALATLWMGRGGRSRPRWMAGLTLVLSLWACTVLARTAQLGGMIEHPETREGYTAPPRPVRTPKPSPPAP
jgi:hypothetical protein